MDKQPNHLLPFPQWLRMMWKKKGYLKITMQNPELKMMVAYWEEYRPEMYKYLKVNGILYMLATYLVGEAWSQAWAAEEAGEMPVNDALELAQRESYMMEPEMDEETGEATSDPMEALSNLQMM